MDLRHRPVNPPSRSHLSPMQNVFLLHSSQSSHISTFSSIRIYRTHSVQVNLPHFKLCHPEEVESSAKRRTPDEGPMQFADTTSALKPRYSGLGTRHSGLATHPRHLLLSGPLPGRLGPFPLLIPPIVKRLVRRLFLHLSSLPHPGKHIQPYSCSRICHAERRYGYNLNFIHAARIAELLQPFLSPTTNPCHSEPGRRPGEESAVLSPSQLNGISTYIDILLRWNARINLTAIRDPEEIVTRHFGESLFAARHLFPKVYPVSSSVSPVSSVVKDFAFAEARSQKPEARVADLGSGAGFPGIPIKLWAPQIALTLIESSHKKAMFLREVARALTLTNIDIQN